MEELSHTVLLGTVSVCGNFPQHHGPLSLCLSPSLPHPPGCLQERGVPSTGAGLPRQPMEQKLKRPALSAGCRLWILIMIITIYCLLSARCLAPIISFNSNNPAPYVWLLAFL